MNKKLICLLLCFAFLVPALVSCSKSSDALSDTAAEASRYTTTLNVWLITEEGTDPEQAAAVNAAINKITKAKFKTQLNIKYLTESEYYGAVEAAFAQKKQALEEEKKAAAAAAAAIKEAAKRGETITTTESTTVEETFLNEYGIPELKYPVVPDYEVDILFIGNYEKYRQYADNEWLSSMDDVMADSGSELTYYINHIFREAASYGGVTYAMPNNRVIGEYTFLAVDEDLFAQYGYDAATMENPSIYNQKFYEVLNYAYKNGITPIYSESGKVDLSLVHYWNFSIDGPTGTAVQHPDVFSIYGAAYSNQAKRGDRLNTNLIFRDIEYRRRVKFKTEYETTEGFITTDPEARTAVKIFKGSYEMKEQYENSGYKVLTMESPRATDENVYDSMFGIGYYTSDSSRAMEIITYLNTNSEFRNLLQYGVQDVNYVLNTFVDETDGKEYSYVTPTETNAYHMDINKTGNVFIAYPDSRENVKLWEYQKKQNLEATTDPTLGLYFSTDYPTNTETILVLNAVSAEVKKYMDANLTTTAAVDKFFTDFDAASTSSAGLARFLLDLAEGDIVYNAEGAAVTREKLVAAINAMRTTEIKEEDAKNPQSPAALYNDWLANSGVQNAQ